MEDPQTREGSPQDPEALDPERIQSLARAAVGQYGPRDLPASLDREDLEQTAATEIVSQARAAWENGRATEAGILIKAAKRKVAQEVGKAQEARGTPIQDSDGAEDLGAQEKARSLLVDLLDLLEPREREAVIRRYGLKGPPETFSTIARSMGIVESTAYRLVQGALDKMAEEEGTQGPQQSHQTSPRARPGSRQGDPGAPVAHPGQDGPPDGTSQTPEPG